MIEYITGIIVLLSALVVLISSIGIISFKNLYARMHVVTKVSSFAILLLLIAINLLFLKISVVIQTLIIFHVLIFLSPVAAHVIAKISKLLKQYEEEHKTPHEEEQR